MEDQLKQVGELLFSSIPTIICLLVVWMAYRFLVHPRLAQVLKERHARTQGAIEQAQTDIASAEKRVAEYEQKLREARAQIFTTQEKARNRVIEQRNNALAQARKQAEDAARAARSAMEQEVAATKEALHKQADALADEIIRSVLKPGTASAAAGGR